ncbi:MAG TPA: hypothetical protein VEN81_14790 [Planctomycetota bacterium]|nr:hypothetical protein [Planctomycetota bacterium]
MKPIVRMLGLLALAGVVSLPGCIQAEEAATLMPDGSGKLTLRIGLKKSMIEMITQLGKAGGDPKASDPFEQFKDPAKLKTNGEGIVAWGEPKKEEDADWVRVSIPGYFEDINKVKMYGDSPAGGGDAKKLSFGAKFEKVGDGGKLVMSSELTDDFRKKMGAGAPGAPDGAPGGEELAKAMIEAMKPMLEGMRIAVSVTVPGPVEDTGGFLEKKDRTATFAIEGKTIIDAMTDPKGPAAKRMEAFGAASNQGTAVSWSKTTIGAEDIAAFKKEMAAAKESWAKRLKEAEAGKQDK